MRRVVGLAAMVIVVGIVASGCGPERPAMAPVRGVVTFDGGPPPAEGMLFFAPLSVAEGAPRRPARAEFDAEGRFEVTSFEGADGLVPGTYRVRVECWKKAPTMESQGESYVDPAFEGQEYEVSLDAGDQEFNLDVPAAR